MKHLYTLILGLCTFVVFSQAPQFINYQGVARDGIGSPVTNTVIGLQFSISTATNPNFHSETQLAVQVNSLGLFNTRIGISPQLPSTGWESLPAVLSVSISVNGGGFVALGSQTLASVPYALYALTSGSGNALAPGTRNGQTLRWDSIPMAWVADNNLTNDGSHVGIGLYPAGLRSRLHVTSNSVPDTTVIFGYHSNISPKGAGLRSIVVGNTNFNNDPFATAIYGGNHSALNLGGGMAVGNLGLGNSNGNAIGIMGIGYGAGPTATATGIYATAIGATGAKKMAAVFDQGSVFFNDSIFIVGSNTVGVSIGNVLTLSSTGRAKWSPVPGGISSIVTNGPLTGGPITSTGTISLLPSGVVPGNYGGAPNVVPTFSVDAFGRIMSAGSFSLPAPVSNSLNGNVQGTFLSNTVVALQGFPVSATTPTIGQILAYAPPGVWTPTTPPTAPLAAWIKSGSTVTLATNTDLVGVGAASPTEKLQVESGSPTRISIVSPANNTNSLWLGTTGNHSLGIVSYNTALNEMNFGTNATFNRLRIFGSGDIAFGSPLALNPAGSFAHFSKPGANDTKVLISGGDGSNTFGGILSFGENQSPSFGMSIRLDAIANRLLFTNDLNGSSPVMAIGGYLGANNGVMIGSGYTGSQAPVNGLAVQGNVGIGTTAPTSLLHVNGAVRISDGTEGLGEVLTSDASGNASWQNKNTAVTSITPPGCQVLNAVTTTPTQVGSNLASFTKINAGTIVEITFQTFINVSTLTGANGVVYELRVDGVPAANNAGKTVYFRNNGGVFTISANDQITLHATFPSLGAGAHTVSLYVYTNAGTATDAYYDPGCWSTNNVTIKEFW